MAEFRRNAGGGEFGINPDQDFINDAEIETVEESNSFINDELIPFAARLLHGSARIDFGRTRRFTFENQSNDPEEPNYMLLQLEFEQRKATQSFYSMHSLLSRQ